MTLRSNAPACVLAAAAQGDTLGLRLQFVSTDGKNDDDCAWARLVHAGDGSLAAWLFTAQSTSSKAGQVMPGQVVSQDAFDPDAAIDGDKHVAFNSETSADPVGWSTLGGSNGRCGEDNAPGCGHTGWLATRHTGAAAGQYRLEVGVDEKNGPGDITLRTAPGAQVMAMPPAQYHARLRGARWGVVLPRSIPGLTAVGRWWVRCCCLASPGRNCPACGWRCTMGPSASWR